MGCHFSFVDCVNCSTIFWLSNANCIGKLSLFFLNKKKLFRFISLFFLFKSNSFFLLFSYYITNLHIYRCCLMILRSLFFSKKTIINYVIYIYYSLEKYPMPLPMVKIIRNNYKSDREREKKGKWKFSIRLWNQFLYY